MDDEYRSEFFEDSLRKGNSPINLSLLIKSVRHLN